jgi:hypothetical protein
LSLPTFPGKITTGIAGSLWSSGVHETVLFTSVYGETVELYGGGLYTYDSLSAAAQAIAQDWVTLILGIPLLAAALGWEHRAARRNSSAGSTSGAGVLRARFLLTGTLGYFLYTYMSYAFLLWFNPLFLVYVALFSLSLFAFILAFAGTAGFREIETCFSSRFPRKSIAGFTLFLAFFLFMAWMGRIAPALLNGTAPVGIEHYTTLVIQVMDLGIIVPAALLSGILLLQRKALGYLLAPVVLVKGFTMSAALVAMIIGMLAAGVEVAAFEIAMFPVLGAVDLVLMVLMFKSIRKTPESP